ncbi:hypothetical protein HPB49_010743 [Dermacentor silvarum]|uniref:Uncharacterized protein n=1 Tax=Dermacentor silvarum TaxID=543639 RepID=A0ACB8DZP8_DERSI|nr:hypothetical protein HPB49_010743 [Dermacentor silvarum]
MLCRIIMDSGIHSAFGGNPEIGHCLRRQCNRNTDTARVPLCRRVENTVPKRWKEKVEIPREVDAGKQSKNEIAKKHDIPRSTLSTYIRNKKTIEDSYAAETFAKDRKRIRTAKHPDLEAALLAWIKEKRSQDIPLSGPIIVAKAADFALRLNLSDFAASGSDTTSFSAVCAAKPKP